jgi:hypothetical protein
LLNQKQSPNGENASSNKSDLCDKFAFKQLCVSIIFASMAYSKNAHFIIACFSKENKGHFLFLI